LFTGVKALEHLKDAAAAVFFHPDSVVGDSKAHHILDHFGADANRGRPFAAELEGIADQVLKNLPELHLIGLDGRQDFLDDDCLIDLHDVLQANQDRGNNGSGVGKLQGLRRSANPGVSRRSVMSRCMRRAPSTA